MVTPKVMDISRGAGVVREHHGARSLGADRSIVTDCHGLGLESWPSQGPGSSLERPSGEPLRGLESAVATAHEGPAARNACSTDMDGPQSAENHGIKQ